MIKFLTTFLLIGFSFYSSGDQGVSKRNQSVSNKCFGFFRSRPVKYNLSENTDLTSAYSMELFSAVYRKLPSLEGTVLSRGETNLFVSHIEELIRHIESSSDFNVRSRLELMNSRWSSAVEAFPAIVSFVNSGKTNEYESLDTKTIVKLVLSALGHHTMAYLTHPKTEVLDWPRMSFILKSIAEFTNQPSVFSLYKIKRAVEGKYSLNEYINCK